MENQDLRELRPIRLGWLKALTPVVGLGIWQWLVMSQCMAVWKQQLNLEVVVYVVFSGFLVWFFALSRGAIKHFLGYWRRNIVSYRVAFWLKDGQLCYGVYLRGQSTDLCQRLKVEPDVGPIVVLALGGWFHSSCFYQSFVSWFSGESGNPDERRKSGWRVQPDWSCSDVRARFTDCYGDAVNIPVEEFLRRKGDPAFVDAFRIGWRLIFQAAVNKIDQLRREGKWSIERLEWCQNEVVELRGQRDMLAGAVQEWAEKYAVLLIGMIEQLDATKRFIKSKQAKAIREEMVAELLGMLPAEDPRRQKYAAELAKNARDKAASLAKPAAPAQG